MSNTKLAKDVVNILSGVSDECDNMAFYGFPSHSKPAAAISYLKYNFRRKLEEDSNSNALHVQAINEMLEHDASLPVSVDELYVDGTCRAIINTAREICHGVLGSLPSREEMEAGIQITSGANAKLTRRNFGDPAIKLANYLDGTPLAIRLWQKLFGDTILGPVPTMSVKGSRITTVPKNKDKRRTINCEPAINVALQSSVGKSIRRRLLRKTVTVHGKTYPCSINLRNQKINQFGALQASLGNGFVTIDLERASDSVSLPLVEALVPIDWYYLLISLRSDFAEVDGSYVPLRKISAMGNAYTFELESLIFFSLTLAASIHSSSLSTFSYEGTDRIVSVYGDDIICPFGAVQLLKHVFKACHLVVNNEKSYTTGSFYESCGKHYLDGYDITPVYLRKVPSHPAELIELINKFRRWADRTGLSRYEKVDRALVALLPERMQKAYQHDGNGDGCLITCFYEDIAKPFYFGKSCKIPVYRLVVVERDDIPEKGALLNNLLLGRGVFQFDRERLPLHVLLSASTEFFSEFVKRLIQNQVLDCKEEYVGKPITYKYKRAWSHLI